MSDNKIKQANAHQDNQHNYNEVMKLMDAILDKLTQIDAFGALTVSKDLNEVDEEVLKNCFWAMSDMTKETLEIAEHCYGKISRLTV